jgi:hypothetical protein
MDYRFINNEYLKTNSTVPITVDDKYITTAITSAQNNNIKRLIGSGIYRELQYQLSANTLTVLNRTLLDDYIQPVLLWYSLKTLIKSIHFKLSPTGVQKMEPENSSPADKSELVWLEETFTNDAETCSDTLIKYLQQNQASYPLYYNPGNGIDTINPSSNPYGGTGGIFFYD